MSDTTQPPAQAAPPAQVVLVCTSVPALSEALAGAVRTQRPDLEVHTWRRDLPDDLLARVDVLLGWTWPPQLTGRLPRLRWVCCSAAGVDKLLVPGLPPSVPVSRIVDPDQAVAIAQYVATVLLAQVRQLPVYQAQQQARQWLRHPLGASRQTVGVLGYGEVGQEIGRVLGALGFSVAGWRSRSGPLTEFLADREIVVVSLPLTAQTHGLLNAQAFAAMPRGAYLINIARGQHVVEADLIAALASGHLAGAALDVQQTEPMTADDPLWTTPGVLVTPHIAGQSSNAVVVGQFLAGLAALDAGAALPNVVDRGRGY